MTDGHRTSTIPRPRTHATGSGARPRLVDVSRLDGATSRAPTGPTRRDLTTPIERSKQLVPHRRGKWVMGLFATVIAVAIGAALFVLPVKSWMRQRDDLATRTDELSTLTDANDQLQTEVDRLQTDAGIKEAARQEIDYIEDGEQRITVIDPDPLSMTLPTGWPFDMINGIVNAERTQLAAEAAAQTTAAPAVVDPATDPAVVDPADDPAAETATTVAAQTPTATAKPTNIGP